jgi:NTP pyrophosphatase (non-canonical NTP hydrolase)
MSATKQEEYLDFLRTTKWYKHANMNDSGELAYLSLGLAGESGEFTDLTKKICRDYGYSTHIADISPAIRGRLRDELGDVLWYLTQLCDYLGVSLDELMDINMNKLKAREANDGEGRQHV